MCLKILGWTPLHWPKLYKLHDLAISGQQLNIMLQPIAIAIHIEMQIRSGITQKTVV